MTENPGVPNAAPPSEDQLPKAQPGALKVKVVRSPAPPKVTLPVDDRLEESARQAEESIQRLVVMVIQQYLGEYLGRLANFEERIKAMEELVEQWKATQSRKRDDIAPVKEQIQQVESQVQGIHKRIERLAVPQLCQDLGEMKSRVDRLQLPTSTRDEESVQQLQQKFQEMGAELIKHKKRVRSFVEKKTSSVPVMDGKVGAMDERLTVLKGELKDLEEKLGVSLKELAVADVREKATSQAAWEESVRTNRRELDHAIEEGATRLEERITENSEAQNETCEALEDRLKALEDKPDTSLLGFMRGLGKK